MSRFLGLLTHSDTKVLVSIVDALPAVISHTKLNPQMINQYISLLDHQDKQVVSAMCRQLSELVCQGVQSDSSQVLFLNLVFFKRLEGYYVIFWGVLLILLMIYY